MTSDLAIIETSVDMTDTPWWGATKRVSNDLSVAIALFYLILQGFSKPLLRLKNVE